MNNLNPNYQRFQSTKKEALANIKRDFLASCSVGLNYGYTVNASAKDPAYWYAEMDYGRQFYYDPTLAGE